MRGLTPGATAVTLLGVAVLVGGAALRFTSRPTTDSLIPGCFVVIAAIGALTAGIAILTCWRRIGWTLRAAGLAALLLGLAPLALIGSMFF